jgi:putative membrane protein
MSDLQDPRVLFAAERTLLAWNRTGLAFMAFGFAVERTGLLMRALLPQAASHVQPFTAFALGAGLIVLGSITAWYSAHQYAVVLHSLTPAELPPGYTAKWGFWVNRSLAVLGLALVAILALWHLG